MKALTIKQPWAYLICSGIKDIENRTWKCPQKYIGQRVLIHASAKSACNNGCSSNLFTEQQLRSIKQNFPASAETDRDFEGNSLHDLSAIIGSIYIVDCVRNHQSIWAVKDSYNWLLAHPILFDKPILNVKGKLSFWEYPGIKEVNIECPSCGSHEVAIVDYNTMPFPTYIHKCSKCGYVIMESEWNVI